MFSGTKGWLVRNNSGYFNFHLYFISLKCLVKDLQICQNMSFLQLPKNNYLKNMFGWILVLMKREDRYHWVKHRTQVPQSSSANAVQSHTCPGTIHRANLCGSYSRVGSYPWEAWLRPAKFIWLVLFNHRKLDLKEWTANMLTHTVPSFHWVFSSLLQLR